MFIPPVPLLVKVLCDHQLLTTSQLEELTTTLQQGFAEPQALAEELVQLERPGAGKSACEGGKRAVQGRGSEPEPR
jgi:hypothetical protein